LECGVTHGTTDALDGKQSGSATTYASLDPKTAANRASSQPAPHPGNPDTPAPSQP
jgi:hypothetical protein